MGTGLGRSPWLPFAALAFCTCTVIGRASGAPASLLVTGA